MKKTTNKFTANSISEIWLKDKQTFHSKSLSQILGFAGDGKLRDNNNTSVEFRELLDQIPTELIDKFVNSCLEDSFTDSGLALQDIINQIGNRLEFSVENGLYRGKRNDIGFDGIWKSKDGFSIVVEVKTTDTYRMNLDTIAKYRRRLIQEERIDKANSSILIVVGRDDTGDLEAQIRGSRHAWDIRVISTESLLKLLSIKETLNDPKVIHQINEILKPKEYTRLYSLIELMFVTSQDIQTYDNVVDSIDEEIKDIQIKRKSKASEEKVTPVNFYEECLSNIQLQLKTNLIKRNRISFTNKDKTLGLVCSISKKYKQGQNDKYWFAFHPHQMDFLDSIIDSYVAYGCGSPDKIVLIPYSIFKPLLDSFWITEKENRMYWHIVIHERDGKLLLAQPNREKGATFDITRYKITQPKN